MMRKRVVLKTISHYLTPFIIMYGCYIQLHGDYSPGGGFQAGVIVASAFFLYAFMIGMDEMLEVLPMRVMHFLCCFGPLLYAGVGVAAMLQGGEFLNYSALIPENPLSGQHIGIIIIELGVGITVFAVMMIIFTAFVQRQRQKSGK